MSPRSTHKVEGIALDLPVAGGADEAIGSTELYPFIPPPTIQRQPHYVAAADLASPDTLLVVGEQTSDPSLVLPVPPPAKSAEEIEKEHKERQRLTFLPGHRVNYRSVHEIRTALQYGYLELDYILMGQSASMTVRLISDSHYQYASRYLGNYTAMHPFEYKRLEDLMDRVDLHAFRWYPNGAYMFEQ